MWAAVKWRVRLEVWAEVEADDEESAGYAALNDLAFGRVGAGTAQATLIERADEDA